MSIYKECDIRGVYQKDISEEDALLIGKAVGTMVKGASIVVGGDTRDSTSSLKSSLIEGLLSAGCSVIDIGLVTTPMSYFAKNLLGTYGAVMVTASHNPTDYNGFKLVLGNDPITHSDILQIRRIVEQRSFTESTGTYATKDILAIYSESLSQNLLSKGTLKVVVDCGNGAASIVAPKLCNELGYDVIPLFCEVLGNFPNRSPNPSVAKNLQALKERVIAEKADIGVAFDGDGDRVIFIDDRGDFCDSEAIFLLLIDYYLSINEGGCVVYDGKSSSIVKNGIEKRGAVAIAERSGHAFIRKRFLQEQAIIAGEVSGHFFFAELGYDDGLYAALRLFRIVEDSHTTLSSLMKAMERPLITPDLRIYLSETEIEKILRLVEFKGKGYPVSYLDGIRVDFPSGWLLARKSVTEPCITIRMEASDIISLERLAKFVFNDTNPVIVSMIVESV